MKEVWLCLRRGDAESRYNMKSDNLEAVCDDLGSDFGEGQLFWYNYCKKTYEPLVIYTEVGDE